MTARGIIFFWILTFVACISCEDIVKGSVLESSDAQPGSESMPDNVTVNVTVGGQDVQLDLKVDHNASVDIPVYVFSRDEIGQLETQRVKRKKGKGFAVYRDVKHGAVFSARRDLDTGRAHLSLEGLMEVDGKMYDLKSSKRRYRSRNSTAENNPKPSSEAHDVKRLDVSGNDTTWSGQNEAEDQHEFVVRLRDDLPASALTGDAAPPPIREEKKVKVKKVMNVELQRHLAVSAAAAAPPPASQEQTTTRDIYIDVVAVADYGFFSNLLSDSSGATADEKTMDVLDKTSQYFAFVFSGVNMLYESINSLPYNMHVKLSTIIVATRPADSPWTESLRSRAFPRSEVDSYKALDNFSTWAATADILPSYDHLTLFTGYDLTRKTEYIWPRTDNSVLGISYIGTLCSTTGLSSSIVEDHESFQLIFIVAHELGHSISAKHDGDGNICYEENRYIMSAVFDPPTASNRHNLWQFSSCSVNYFRRFISETNSTARGHQCLYNTITPNKYIPDVSGQQPGQVYDYDEQCRQVYGPSSRMCRGITPTPADICKNLYCDKLDGIFCFAIIPARGTSCGNKKWCVNGDCVYDSMAPAMDDSCPFGDLPGYFWDTYQTCGELIDSHPGYCYNASHVSPCCSSCAKYRGKATSATTPRTSFVTKTSVTASGITVNGSCEDNPSERIQGKTCEKLVADSPAQCYDSHVITSCCASCRVSSTGVTGCEFGDRYPAQCSFAMLNRYSCQESLQETCCQTCADMRTTQPPQPPQGTRSSSSVLWGGLLTSGWVYLVASLLPPLLSD